MKTRLTFFLLVVLLLGLAATTDKSKTLSGHVSDVRAGQPLARVLVKVISTGDTTYTNSKGDYEIALPGPNELLEFSKSGYSAVLSNAGSNRTLNISMTSVSTDSAMAAVQAEAEEEYLMMHDMLSVGEAQRKSASGVQSIAGQAYSSYSPSPVETAPVWNTEEYDVIQEVGFKTALADPLSTFSIDVDAASYANIRRTINHGSQPHQDMVRIEEMINYFDYDYRKPKGQHPFSINTEISTAPWNHAHRLVHVGIQGKKLDYKALNPSNLVFLLDVSGSMSDPNKLPLLKSSLKLLLSQLSEKDKVSIVVYAGAAGLVLEPTPATQKEKIMAALDNLEAGGSTAGGQGIRLAYQVAVDHLIEGGNNRVILCTDGDFNVGVSSTAEMVRLIEEKRKAGVFLTIAGFGMGNYKDGRMEQISNAGNGNYYYIDNIKEAQKVFVTEMRATLFTIAKDVKIQVEFNPAKVQAYRLIGYENRMLQKEDFNDDKKDAGELGAGHTVTALYEIIPVGVDSEFTKTVDELRYQPGSQPQPALTDSEELLTVKFRYKEPNGTKSKLITHPLVDEQIALAQTSENFRWSAAVAEYGLLLRDSDYKHEADYAQVIALAQGAKGEDEHGYRAEFINLVKSSKLLIGSN